ncbi:histidine phosphatase family protein [Tateyamaria omphalii]|uniref:SixA phosphatase family protein n=1 Tax=Tateyamaria omphalii TaxID=299262 RepID=UPI001C99F760|nr:histidine phosphatase family protein [Tateyamaria omphalii]MBY5931413.1 histidine phosphatase family protein [Tateyamaria omphalii]
MTRTLILMRHAKSSWDKPDLADHDRPLNPRGVASAEAMGQWLRDNGHVPDAAVSSSSERTGQTFLGLKFDIPITFTRALYHAGPEMMMEVLQGQSAETVLMLGHNPGIADFADRIVAQPPRHPRFADYPTCAATVIRFDTDTWNDIGWREAQPIDFAIPREVMR